MIKRMLCIEDAEEYQTLIANALGGFELHFCSTLAEARARINEPGAEFDLILLDVSLPDGNGIEFLPELKSIPKLEGVPIFILTVSDAILNKVAAFGVGVDDYICKPFNPLELRSRVEARLRHADHLNSSRRQVGNLVLDQSRMRIHFSQNPARKIDVTPIEFKILFFMSRRPDVIFSRQQIIDEVWGPSTYITDRTVDAHVSHIRKKLEQANVSIQTVQGVGYKVTLAAN